MGLFPDDEFYLMNKDKKVLSFRISSGFETVGFHGESRLPLGFGDVRSWLEGRKAPKHRAHIERLIRQCGCETVEGFARTTHALSLNDTFWVKPVGSPLLWREVSLYENDFDRVIAHIAFEGGMYGERFSSTTPELTTDGSYAKCWIRVGDAVFLKKTGSRGAVNAGLEPYSEAMASQLAGAFLDSYIEYMVVPSKKNPGDIRKASSVCRLFTSDQTGFAQYRRVKPIAESLPSIDELLAFYAKIGSEAAFRKMVVFDGLCLNEDRHPGNHGVLFDADTLDLLGMAPVFDNNLAFLPLLSDDRYDELDDYISRILPKIGDDFNNAAHEMLTASLKRELRNLRGFEFDRSLLPGLPEERIALMEKLVDRQIDGILRDVTLYVDVDFSFEEDLQTLDGWPEDEFDMPKVHIGKPADLRGEDSGRRKVCDMLDLAKESSAAEELERSGLGCSERRDDER